MMSPKSQVRLSGLCLVAMIIAVFVYGIMVFYVPVILASYTETGQELPAMLKLALYIDDLVDVDKNTFLIVPLLVLGIVAAFVWRKDSSIKAHRMKQMTNRSG